MTNPALDTCRKITGRLIDSMEARGYACTYVDYRDGDGEEVTSKKDALDLVGDLEELNLVFCHRETSKRLAFFITPFEGEDCIADHHVHEDADAAFNEALAGYL